MNSDLYLNDDSDDISSESPFDSINDALYNTIQHLSLTPQNGLQRIRNVLLDFGYDIDPLFDMNPDGDEYAYKIGDIYLYIIYAPNENGYYEFYSEVTDENGINEIMKSGDDDEYDAERALR